VSSRKFIIFAVSILNIFIIMTEKKMSYEEAFRRLQEIQDRIEQGDPSVDELETILLESAKLLKICKDKLYKVDEETQKIIQNMQK
jgi:exodeoxyribonuclease VII small subunit